MWLHTNKTNLEFGYIGPKLTWNVVTYDQNYFGMWLHMTKTNLECGYIRPKLTWNVVTYDQN